MSNIETTLGSSPSDVEPELERCWIKFNPDTGKIFAISSDLIEDADDACLVIESTSEIALEARTAKLRRYRVKRSVFNDEWEILGRSKRLVIRDADYPIYRIADRDSRVTDIHVKMFKDTGEIEVKSNREQIKSSMNLSAIHEIVSTDDIHMNMYITSKTDPDVYLGKMDIDPVELIVDGRQRFELSDVTRHMDWKDICIYTRRIFNKYSYEITTTELDIEDINNRRIQTSVHSDGHLVVAYTGNNVRVYSHITEENSHVVSNNKSLMFLISDDIIDNMVGVFYVSVQDIIENDFVDIDIDFEWPTNPIALYNNARIRVKMAGGAE